MSADDTRDEQRAEREVSAVARWIFGLTMAGVAAYAGAVFAWILL